MRHRAVSRCRPRDDSISPRWPARRATPTSRRSTTAPRSLVHCRRSCPAVGRCSSRSAPSPKTAIKSAPPWAPGWTSRCTPCAPECWATRAARILPTCLLRLMSVVQSELDPLAREFYCHTLRVLEGAKLPTLIGGAYAFARYTGIGRHTKDIDVFVREQHFQPTLTVLKQAGFKTETTCPHWLGKAYHGEFFVDLIFSSGNGLARVDDDWFSNAVDECIFDVPVKLVPPEEMIWSKAFIQERERFDGADIAHLLRACGESIDWSRLLRRFAEHWQVLLSHLVLFGFIYPAERERVPSWLMHALLRRLEDTLSAPTPTERICRGTVLSRQQYLFDLEGLGYRDARSEPDNPMTADEIATWTAGIANDGSTD